MKKLFMLMTAAVVFAACNNEADSTGDIKDSLDSIANEKIDVIDSTAEAKKEVVDSTIEAKKDALTGSDTADKKD